MGVPTIPVELTSSSTCISGIPSPSATGTGKSHSATPPPGIFDGLLDASIHWKKISIALCLWNSTLRRGLCEKRVLAGGGQRKAWAEPHAMTLGFPKHVFLSVSFKNTSTEVVSTAENRDFKAKDTGLWKAKEVDIFSSAICNFIACWKVKQTEGRQIGVFADKVKLNVILHALPHWTAMGHANASVCPGLCSSPGFSVKKPAVGLSSWPTSAICCPSPKGTKSNGSVSEINDIRGIRELSSGCEGVESLSSSSTWTWAVKRSSLVDVKWAGCRDK